MQLQKGCALNDMHSKDIYLRISQYDHTLSIDGYSIAANEMGDNSPSADDHRLPLTNSWSSEAAAICFTYNELCIFRKGNTQVFPSLKWAVHLILTVHILNGFFMVMYSAAKKLGSFYTSEISSGVYSFKKPT